MNERIKQLIEQAEEYAFDELNKLQGPVEMSISRRVFEQSFREKFAELIVQECLTFVRPNSYFQAYPENMIGGEDGVKLLQTITNQIEEHFGVEE